MSFGHTFSANSKRAREGEKVTRRESGFLPKSTNAIFHKSQKLAASEEGEERQRGNCAVRSDKKGFSDDRARPPISSGTIHSATSFREHRNEDDEIESVWLVERGKAPWDSSLMLSLSLSLSALLHPVPQFIFCPFFQTKEKVQSACKTRKLSAKVQL